MTLGPEDLRRLHEVQFEMLREFDRVARRLGLRYQLGAGTLLGAIRHGGFIPWDDDVDLVMLRADYERFLAQAPDVLGRDYFLQTWHTDPDFELPFAKLRRHDSEFRECCRAGGRCHHGIFIDVFPFDAVSTTHWWGRLHLQAVLLERRLRDFIQDPRRRLSSRATPPWKRGLKRVAYAGLRRIPEPLWRAAQERLFTLLRHTAAESVTCLASSPPGPAGLRSRIRPRSELEQSVQVPFATARFPAPRAYHVTLTRLYGDYRRLPPHESQRPSHPVVAFRAPSPDAQTAMPAGLPSGKTPVRQVI